jgi:IS1 family transposase
MLDGIIFIVLMLLAAFCLLCSIIVFFLENHGNEYEWSGKIIASMFFLIIGAALPIFLGFSKCDTGKKIVKWKYGQEAKIEKKVKELNDLYATLSQKQKEVAGLQADYQRSIKELEKEIRSDQKKYHISTYEQASQNSRISYDLALIQRKEAYITKLDEVAQRLQTGTLELEFLRRQSEDDLKMVKVMDKEEIDKLAGQINTVIEKYLPEAGNLAIEIDENSLESPEQIWQRIAQGQ